jgi:hypothetical protein
MVGSAHHFVSRIDSGDSACRNELAFGPVRLAGADGELMQCAEKARWVGSASASLFAVQSASARCIRRIAGGIIADVVAGLPVATFGGPSHLGVAPSSRPGKARARAGNGRPCRGNKAHGRNGCSIAGNGGWSPRTRQWSKALKLAALRVCRRSQSLVLRY